MKIPAFLIALTGLCAPALAQEAPASTPQSGLSVDVTDESGGDLVIAIPALPDPMILAPCVDVFTSFVPTSSTSVLLISITSTPIAGPIVQPESS